MNNDFLPLDIEVDQILINGEDDDPAPNHYKMVSENHKYKPNHNDPKYDRHVSLSRRRKAWFFISYSSFLIMYLLFVLVMACTYPLEPVCSVDDLIKLPVSNKESANITKQMKNSVSLRLNFINRNPIISYLYDDFLHITICYDPRDSECVQKSSATAPGFHQRHRNNKKVEVSMPAPGWLQQHNNLSSVNFYVMLVFKVRFNCRVACTHKASLLMTLDCPGRDAGRCMPSHP